VDVPPLPGGLEGHLEKGRAAALDCFKAGSLMRLLELNSLRVVLYVREDRDCRMSRKPVSMKV
jgi:uncharacterized protein YhdP